LSKSEIEFSESQIEIRKMLRSVGKLLLTFFMDWQ